MLKSHWSCLISRIHWMWCCGILWSIQATQWFTWNRPPAKNRILVLMQKGRGPDTGMFLSLAALNHWRTACSVSLNVAVLIFFLWGLSALCLYASHSRSTLKGWLVVTRISWQLLLYLLFLFLHRLWHKVLFQSYVSLVFSLHQRC